MNKWIVRIGLVAAVLLVFGRVVGNGFVNWDDNVNIYQNPQLNPVTWHGVRGFWQRPYAGLYIPLTYTLWAVLAAARSATGTLLPAVFHGFSLFLHASSVLVVFELLLGVQAESIPPPAARKSGGGRAPIAPSALWPAAAGALAFALHPVQVESVAWATGMKDLLSGLLGLTAIAWCLRGAAHAVARPRLQAGLATAAFALALLAKPAAMSVPLAALALFWLARGAGGAGAGHRAAVRLCCAWLVAAAGWGVLTLRVQPAADEALHAAFWTRPLVALDALAFYLYKLALPLRLAPDYGRSPAEALARGWLYWTWLAPCGLAALLWRASRRGATEARGLVAAALVGVAALLPVMGLVPFDFQAFSTVADRYAYAAMLGPALAVAVGVRRLEGTGRAGAWRCAWAALFLFWGACSSVQAGHWRDTGRLFAHALRVNSRSSKMHINMGNEYRQAGRFAEAMRCYYEALKVKPDFAEARNNLGIAAAEQGDSAGAVAHYRDALRLNPAYAEAHDNLGIALGRLDRIDEAIPHFSRAVELRPDFAEAHNNLGTAWTRLGKTEAALAAYGRALDIAPGYAEARVNLAQLLAEGGRADEAVAHFSAALRVKPGHASAHAGLAALLDETGRRPDAMAHYMEAIRLDPEHLEAHYNLGLAFAEAGDAERARACFREALRIDPSFAPAAESLRRLR